MSVAIRLYDPLDYTSTKSIIYFSATTNFERRYSSNVPRHPVDKGADISDHSSPNNAEYSISGIVSEVDLSGNTSYITSQLGEPILNHSDTVRAVTLQDSGGLVGNLLSSFVPDFLSQFYNNHVNIVVDERGRGWTVDDVRKSIINATRGVRWNEDLERNETYPLFVELIILDKQGNLEEKVDSNLLIERFSDRADQDTGDALFFDLTLVEARVADLKTTTVDSSKVSEDMKNTTSKTTNAGKQTTDTPTSEEKAEAEGAAKSSTSVWGLLN